MSRTPKVLLSALCALFAVGIQAEEGELLQRVRQLTFEGKRAGEGYYHPDGKRMVFQSEREPGNPFYQIYELDLETGETRRVSPGTGKTTCAFIRPRSTEILFSSTHHDPESERLQREELEFRASGETRRYAWDYDPEMEIWIEKKPGGPLERLTETFAGTTPRRVTRRTASGSSSPPIAAPTITS